MFPQCKQMANVGPIFPTLNTFSKFGPSGQIRTAGYRNGVKIAGHLEVQPELRCRLQHPGQVDGGFGRHIPLPINEGIHAYLNANGDT